MSGRLYLGAPPGQRWPISLDTVEDQLRRLTPSIALTRYSSPVTHEETINFDLRMPDGQVLSGAYADGGTLVMNDASPADWATTAAGILQLLPSDTPVYAMVENDEPTPVPVPASVRTPEAVAVFFDALEQ
jgi:hypothetical protein